MDDINPKPAFNVWLIEQRRKFPSPADSNRWQVLAVRITKKAAIKAKKAYPECGGNMVFYEYRVRKMEATNA